MISQCCLCALAGKEDVITVKYHYKIVQYCCIEMELIILMKFSSLAALEVVILTTSSAASDENV